MSIARIRKDDTVIVTHGNDAGRTEESADYLKDVKEGKFQFNGAGVKMLSMKVMSPR